VKNITGKRPELGSVLENAYTRFLAIAFHGFEKFIDKSNGDFDDEGWKSTSIPEYTSFRTDLVGMLLILFFIILYYFYYI
jgi:hypothetical protein